MQKIILFVFILSVSACGQNKGYKPYDEALSMARNVAENAVVLQKGDYRFLDKILRKKQIVILGESSHYDLSTTETKIKMLRQLKSRGFDYLAIECGTFLSSYVFSSPDYAELTKNWKFEDFFTAGIWLQQETFTPLVKAINDREIKILGMDTYLMPHDVKAAKCILERHSTHDETADIDWDGIENLYTKLSYMLPLSTDEQYTLMRSIAEMAPLAQFLMEKSGEHTDLRAIIQWVRNVGSFYYDCSVESLPLELVDRIPSGYRGRDVQMAENVVWFTENLHKVKMALWCANFHGIRNNSLTVYPSDSLMYFKFNCMGEDLYNRLGSKMYSLAFTSFNSFSEDGKTYKGFPEYNYLEGAISTFTNDAEYAFIDFEPLRYADGYRDEEFAASMIGIKQGKWLNMFDGVYYIRDQRTNYQNPTE